MSSAMFSFHHSKLFLVWCLGCALGLGMSPAPARADRKEEAHQASDRGDRLFAKAEYGAALVEYEASYAKYAKPYLLFRIGECHRFLSHAVEAVASYKKYVAKVSRGAERAKAQQYIAEMQPALDAAKAGDQPVVVEAKPVPQAADTEAPPMTDAELAKKRLEDERRAKLLPKVTTATEPKPDSLPPGYDPANLVHDPTDPVSPEDIPPPTPLYKKWWLWTIVGGVVVVGAAVGLGLAFGLPKFQSELPVGGPGASALKVSF